MALNNEQRRIIDSKIKNNPCPLCGGKVRFYTEPFQLLSFPYDAENGIQNDISKVGIFNYLAAECQECGYVVLRRLEALLGQKVSVPIRNQPAEKTKSKGGEG